MVLLLFASIALATYLLRPDEPRLFITRLNQLSLGVQTRVTRWNWKDTQEEVFCRAPNLEPSQEPIPNIVHYVLLGTNKAEMSYKTFLSIKATLIRMKPTEVKLHTYGLVESNHWWNLVKHRVTLVEYDRYSLKGPHNRPVNEYGLAHQADFLRLAILQREGGIYLDADIYPFKPFTDLLNSPRDIVMGHEGGNRYGLCNAVIVARAKSEFLRIWRDSYSSFGWTWNYHSVRMPKLLQVQYSDLICPLSPTVFFWPTWAEVHGRYMHSEIDHDEILELKKNMSMYGGAMYENQLTIHQAPSGVSEEDIVEKDTRFNILMRDVVHTEI